MTMADRETATHGSDAATGLWRIETLCCGVLHGVPESALMYMDASGRRVDLPVLVWLLRNGSETLLVDTGPSSPELARLRFHPELDQSGSRTLAEQLALNGLSVEDIDAVINTHLHWDHCGGNPLMQAPIYVQRRELEFASAPLPTQLVPYEASLVGMEAAWLASAAWMRVVEGPTVIRKGISVIPLPGHTPGSQGVLVDTADGRFCVTGDLIDSKENVEGQLVGWPDHVRGVPSGIHTDLEDWYASLRMLQSMDLSLIPAHDWEVLEIGAFG